MKWYDNRASPNGAEPTSYVKRWNFENEIGVDAKHLAIVRKFNNFMGQIDDIGRLLSFY